MQNKSFIEDVTNLPDSEIDETISAEASHCSEGDYIVATVSVENYDNFYYRKDYIDAKFLQVTSPYFAAILGNPLSNTLLNALFNSKQDNLGFIAVPNSRTVNGKALVANITLNKTDIGLGNVDNTSDINKPISTLVQNALNAKQNVLGYIPIPNTRTVNGKVLSSNIIITKADVGLANVEDWSAAAMPLSDAAQAALNQKVDVIPGMGLTPEQFTAIEKAKLASLSNKSRGLFLTEAALQAAVLDPLPSVGDYATVDAGVGSDSQMYIWDPNDDTWVGTGSGGPTTFAMINGSPGDNASLQAVFDTKQNVLGFTAVPNTRLIANKPLTSDIVITKSDVGLANADNTSDLDKPISTLTQAALNAKQNILGYTPVPQSRTVNGKALSTNITLDKTDVGLGNLDNTSDANKPVSIAVNERFDDYLSLITGGTVLGSLSVPDEAYSEDWSGSLQVPTKNSVYDAIEGIDLTPYAKLAGGNHFTGVQRYEESRINYIELINPSNVSSGQLGEYNGGVYLYKNGKYYWWNRDNKVGIFTDNPQAEFDIRGQALVSEAPTEDTGIIRKLELDTAMNSLPDFNTFAKLTGGNSFSGKQDYTNGLINIGSHSAANYQWSLCLSDSNGLPLCITDSAGLGIGSVEVYSGFAGIRQIRVLNGMKIVFFNQTGIISTSVGETITNNIVINNTTGNVTLSNGLIVPDAPTEDTGVVRKVDLDNALSTIDLSDYVKLNIPNTGTIEISGGISAALLQSDRTNYYYDSIEYNDINGNFLGSLAFPEDSGTIATEEWVIANGSTPDLSDYAKKDISNTFTATNNFANITITNIAATDGTRTLDVDAYGYKLTNSGTFVQYEINRIYYNRGSGITFLNLPNVGGTIATTDNISSYITSALSGYATEYWVNNNFANLAGATFTGLVQSTDFYATNSYQIGSTRLLEYAIEHSLVGEPQYLYFPAEDGTLATQQYVDDAVAVGGGSDPIVQVYDSSYTGSISVSNQDVIIAVSTNGTGVNYNLPSSPTPNKVITITTYEDKNYTLWCFGGKTFWDGDTIKTFPGNGGSITICYAAIDGKWHIVSRTIMP